MPLSNSSFRITELDPIQIKENLKTYMRAQEEFTDFDFEGSGMNILLDLLAYNTHYMGFYANMLGAESHLDSAQLRSSVISHAKHIGYTPRSISPATVLAEIVVTPSDTEDTDASVLTLPRWTRFQGQAVDGVNYNFVTVNANNAIKVANNFTFSNVVLKQGEVVTRTYPVNADNPDREFYLPTANVDTDSLYVTVQQSTSNGYTEVYTPHEDITLLRSNSQVYFVEESTTGNGAYKIIFGDGVLGKKPEDGNIVTITYIDTEGPSGNGANSFILVSSINGYDDNVIVTPASPASGGAQRETIEQVRFRAPKAYTAQNRAVIANDYKTLLLRDYPQIRSVAVWGGEEETPPVYGKVYIALKPVTNYEITTIEKDAIIKKLTTDHSIMTVIPEIVDPDYTYLLVRAKVFYDQARTNLDTATLRQAVRNAIIAHNATYLQDFGSRFRVSRLQKDIENIDQSITSATVDLFVQKRLTPSYNQAKNYESNFKFSLDKEGLYTTPSFKVLDSVGTEREVFLEEVPRAYTGVDGINIVNGGNDYEDATVTITGDGTGATATAKIINRKIDSISIVNKGSNYTKATVTISSNTGYGATATTELQYNNGVLRSYYFKSNGEKVIVDDEAGTIDYLTGEVVLTDLTIRDLIQTTNYNDDILTINVPPKELDIDQLRNGLFEIDANDSNSIQIELVAE